MKTKVIVGLTLCCLLFAMGGMILPSIVKAQVPSPIISGYPFSVNFVEDPYRMHGIKVQHLYRYIPGNTKDVFLTVPSDQKFVVTDVIIGDIGELTFRSKLGGGAIAYFNFKNDAALSTHLNSGIVYWNDDEFSIENNESSSRHVTISGYFVDL